MKKRYINLLTVVLSTTVLLGGCGGTKIYSASAADSSLQLQRQILRRCLL